MSRYPVEYERGGLVDFVVGRRTGETEARPQRSHPQPALEPLYPTFCAKPDAQHDITLADLRR